jgi:hypothetical protein
MAGQIPSFASGSNLAIQIGGLHLAYGTNLSWSDDVAHAAVGGIGSYSYDALEPLQYLARGSFSLVRYSTEVRNLLSGQAPFGAAPARSALGASPTTGTDGNSMLRPGSFNPASLLLSRTFDIVVYERGYKAGVNPAGTGSTLTNSADTLNKVFTLSDCRLTSYSITFTPGQLVTENLGFICILVTDAATQPSTTSGS